MKYREFVEALKSLGDTMNQLVEVVENVERDRGSTSRDMAQDSLQTIFDAVRDFNMTIKECEKFSNRKKRYQRNEFGFIDTLTWHTFVEPAVVGLTTRLHLHISRMSLIFKPWEM